MKHENLVIRVEPELKQLYARISAANDMSVSQMIRKHMREITGYVAPALPDPNLPTTPGAVIDLPRGQTARTMSPKDWLNNAAMYAGVVLDGEYSLDDIARLLKIGINEINIKRIEGAIAAFGFEIIYEYPEHVYRIKL